MALKPDIGLLGGSFDPVHRAHIALARTACDTLQLQRVELLPAARPWQRGQLGASPHHRLQMLTLACQGEPQLAVNPLEIQRGGTTYTIDTLEALPPTASYTWILGADQLANFCTWHRWQDILTRVRLAVAQRPGADLQPPRALLEHLHDQTLRTIPFAPMNISSTEIRRRLAAGQPADDMLDARVANYIRAQGLYRPATRPARKPHTH